MPGVLKENFNSAYLTKLFKSVYVAVWSRNLLMKSCKDPKEFARGLEKFVGIKLMNDITAFCFVAATYVAAYLAVKNKLDKDDKIKNALQAANAQKTADLFDTLINPPKDKTKRKQAIAEQRQSCGFHDVFIALLTVLGEKSKNNESYAENIYKKFETKLGRITPWIINRQKDMDSAKKAIQAVINSIFKPSVSSLVNDDSEKPDDDISVSDEEGAVVIGSGSDDESSDSEDDYRHNKPYKI